MKVDWEVLIAKIIDANLKENIFCSVLKSWMEGVTGF